MKKWLFIVTVGLALVFLPLLARAVPGDERWDPQFNWPGTTNVVYAIAVHNGKIYAGGNVSSGSTTNAALAVWDGFQWSTLGIFSGTFAPEIYDMTFIGDTLYVAGSFNAINGVNISSLAKWDGTSWSSMGINSGTVYALSTDGNNLYAGGTFTNPAAGGVTITNIGYWDGSAWHALGGGLGNPGLRAITLKNGQVYAGGNFTNSGSQFITNIAVWNGSAWSAIGGGIGGSSTVLSLAFNGSDLYVGGLITQAGSISVTNIAKWDGTNWSGIGGLSGGSPNVVWSLGVLNGSVCAAGSFNNAGGIAATNFAVWNGSSWSGANGGISATGYRVINNGTSVIVGGNFTAAGNKLMGGIALFDGANWSPVGTAEQINGVSSTVRALASDGTNLYVGGNFSWAGQTNAGFIARFDGTNWQSLDAGLNNTVDAIAVTNNLVYAGGTFTGTFNGQALSYIGLWDGTNWNSLGNAGGLVYALAIGSNGIYAAGTYYNGSSYGSPFFSRWDGTNWQSALHFTNNTLFLMPLSDSFGYDAIAIQNTNIYLGGYITGFRQYDPDVGPSSQTNCGNIIRFDSNYGWIMGTGLNSNVTCMAVISTNLYVGGYFTNANGITASKIAKWSGNYWTNVGSGLIGSGVINALTTMGGNLYAGGSFTNMGGVPANHIAKWDGTNWSALGSGTSFPGLNNSGTILALGSIGNDLYVGGTFRQAGGRGSFNIARWNDQMNFYRPQIGSLFPTNGQFRLRLFGTGGLTNIIQATTNLITWAPILTNSAGIYDFTDSNSSIYPSRFYRAVLGP